MLSPLWYRYCMWWGSLDRKSTRLNSSHLVISYAVFCLKKKKKISLHAVGAALAQIGVVVGCSERILVALHGRCSFRIALDESATLLRFGAGSRFKRCNL